MGGRSSVQSTSDIDSGPFLAYSVPTPLRAFNRAVFDGSPEEAPDAPVWGVPKIVRQGLALLEAAGLVTAVHGKGRFVDVEGRCSLG